MGDRRLARQPGVGPLEYRGNIRMPFGKALHMQLVENRVMPGRARRLRAVPRKSGVHHSGQRRGRRRVGAGIRDRWITHEPTRDRFRIGIEEDFLRVETMPLGGTVRPMHPVAINQTRPRPVQVAMPDLVGFFRKGETPRLDFRFRRIKKAQLDERRVFREQRKIHPSPIPDRPKR